MIHAPAAYNFKVFFGNKIIIAVLCVIALRKPAAKVNSVHKSVKSFHSFIMSKKKILFNLY